MLKDNEKKVPFAPVTIRQDALHLRPLRLSAGYPHGAFCFHLRVKPIKKTLMSHTGLHVASAQQTQVQQFTLCQPIKHPTDVRTRQQNPCLRIVTSNKKIDSRFIFALHYKSSVVLGSIHLHLLLDICDRGFVDSNEEKTTGQPNPLKLH